MLPDVLDRGGMQSLELSVAFGFPFPPKSRDRSDRALLNTRSSLCYRGISMWRGNMNPRISAKNNHMGFGMKTIWDNTCTSPNTPTKATDTCRKGIKTPNSSSSPGFYLLGKFMSKEPRGTEVLSLLFQLLAVGKVSVALAVTRTQSRWVGY